MEYNTNIQPICLATGGRDYVDSVVTVAGWGTLREGGSQPSNLMKVDVKVWRNQDCKSSYGSSAPGGITKHMLCASLPTQDSCSVSVDQLTAKARTLNILPWRMAFQCIASVSAPQISFIRPEKLPLDMKGLKKERFEK